MFHRKTGHVIGMHFSDEINDELHMFAMELNLQFNL